MDEIKIETQWTDLDWEDLGKIPNTFLGATVKMGLRFYVNAIAVNEVGEPLSQTAGEGGLHMTVIKALDDFQPGAFYETTQMNGFNYVILLTPSRSSDSFTQMDREILETFKEHPVGLTFKELKDIMHLG
jgi:hypothetical protein